MMRLKSLYVKDFRSIDGEFQVSLDAPIVLVHGPNGAGKTSLLSAMELALTGSVPSLSRNEPDYLKYLPHKDRPFGEVRVEIADSNQESRIGYTKVTAAGPIGTPALTEIERVFYSERSYLAQSTLGRLFELYQSSDKKSETALERFIKELLGLSRLEAVIDGLHTAGHISRLKGPVPSYGDVRDEISRRENARISRRKVENDLGVQVLDLDRQLHAKVSEFDPSLLDLLSNQPELARRIGQTSDEPADIEMVKLKRELQVWRDDLKRHHEVTPGSVDRVQAEVTGRSAREGYDRWLRSDLPRIENIFIRGAALFSETSLAGESSYLARTNALKTRVQQDLDRVRSLLASHEEATGSRDNLIRQREEARLRLGRLDDQLGSAVSANEGLAEALSHLTSHIQGEICPVCDRNFAETGGPSLAAHLSAKISRMIEQAGRLQALSKDRSQTMATVAQLERQISDLGAQLLPDDARDALKNREADLAELLGGLSDINAIAREGDRLRDESVRATQSETKHKDADQSLAILQSTLMDLSRRSGIVLGTSYTFDEVARTIDGVIAEHERKSNLREQARRAALELLNLSLDSKLRLQELQYRNAEDDDQLSALVEQKEQADAVIESAKGLVRQALGARAKIVHRIFSDKLNAIWRDLFVRLAPDEPFIPAFAVPDASSTKIEIALETVHRRGGKSGNPRAMLSAGNLNTAALTLFLAIHLSVRPELPWLIIDDPVQSMDEVHIAQFAALLRTLSRQMQRQVIVAVHERSLFDYLKLELSPASDGERLNVIELGRNSIGKTTADWKPLIYVPDDAIAV